MERELASVQRVLDITPIPGADAIESARINGWQCVVKKGEFAVGDLRLYLEIDAIPPETRPSPFCGRRRGLLREPYHHGHRTCGSGPCACAARSPRVCCCRWPPSG